MVERDEEKAIGLVDEQMLRIGIVGQPSDVIERLEPLVAAGRDTSQLWSAVGTEPRGSGADVGRGDRALQRKITN